MADQTLTPLPSPWERVWSSPRPKIFLWPFTGLASLVLLTRIHFLWGPHSLSVSLSVRLSLLFKTFFLFAGMDRLFTWLCWHFHCGELLPKMVARFCHWPFLSTFYVAALRRVRVCSECYELIPKELLIWFQSTLSTICYSQLVGSQPCTSMSLLLASLISPCIFPVYDEPSFFVVVNVSRKCVLIISSSGLWRNFEWGWRFVIVEVLCQQVFHLQISCTKDRRIRCIWKCSRIMVQQYP